MLWGSLEGGILLSYCIVSYEIIWYYMIVYCRGHVVGVLRGGDPNVLDPPYAALGTSAQIGGQVLGRSLAGRDEDLAVSVIEGSFKRGLALL